MKKIIILFSGIIISLLFCSTAFASDNFFVGTDTVDEVYEDLDNRKCVKQRSGSRIHGGNRKEN